MADKETAIYFKLGGVKNRWVVKSEDEAVKTFEDIKNKQTVSLVIVTDTVFDWIKDKLGQGKKEIELPLVVSIPTRRGGKSQVDLLAELIKRTVGVEIRAVQACHSKDWISSSKGSCQEEKSSGTETSSDMTTCLQPFHTEKNRSAGSDPCSPQL